MRSFHLHHGMKRVLSRTDAARLLREAHRAHTAATDRAGELIGWALTVLRDNLHARRLKIDYLLQIGHYDSADALIARSMMQGHDRPLMRLRFAQSLHAQGRLQQANTEVCNVLESRPTHCRALTLAARIAIDRGDNPRAVALLSRAHRARPADHATQCLLIQTLLDAGLVDEAAAALEAMANPPANLSARVLRAQNRVLDAVELLEDAVFAETDDAAEPGEKDEALIELITCLEHAGDVKRLRAILPDTADASPEVRLRAAYAMLMLGDFEQAIVALQLLCDAPRYRRRAMALLLVAQALSDRTAEATATLAQITSSNAQVNRSRHNQLTTATNEVSVTAMAVAWLGGMFGRLIADQVDARQTSADPSSSVLQPLLAEAVRSIESSIAERENKAEDCAALHRHRAVCMQATGRAMDAVSSDAVARAFEAQASDNPLSDATSLRRAA